MQLREDMAAALELIVVPAILLTLIVLLLLKSSFGVAGMFAAFVFLSLLYFVIIKLLRQMRRWDHAGQASSQAAFEQAEREGEKAERAARAEVMREAVQSEPEAQHEA